MYTAFGVSVAALSPPAGGLASPVGRPKTRSRMPIFKGLQQAVAVARLVSHPVDHTAQHMRSAALDARTGNATGTGAGKRAACRRPSRRSRQSSLRADAANPTAPNQPCADPTTQLAAHQRTGASRMLLLQHRDQTMVVSPTPTPDPRPHRPPPVRSSAEEQVPQDIADGARHPQSASATAANRRLKLRQRPQAARSLQAAKPEPEHYAIRDLAATSEDFVRQQPLQARKIAAKALPDLILSLHAGTVANRLAGVQQNCCGVQAGLAAGTRPV